VPHLLTEIALEPLEGDSQQALLASVVGAETLPDDLRTRILAAADGNPFFLEELLRSLIEEGAIVQQNGGWRFDHDSSVEVPPTVERVILARIDRLTPACHDVLTASSALGRRFGLRLLQAVADAEGMDDTLHELQRLDLLRATRRWPQPEYRFKHALIQEAAYGTLLPDARRALHRAAAEWLEEHYEDAEGEVLGLLAHHWLAAEDEDKAVDYLARAGDKARLAWSLDEAIGHYRRLLPLLEHRGAERETALVLFKLALALHTALRFREANEAYARAFDLWEPPDTIPADVTLRVRFGRTPAEVDPPRSYNLSDMQAQMALFDRLVERWPEATIVPSLAERWEIADDGLRYVFHLREGLAWSDGTPLTAHDVAYGVKRNLDRERPGVSVAMLFALENAQDYFRGRNDDLDAVGVRALDDRTVEFRLVTPAPYFLSMVNRPDAGPQPRHAIEAHGEAWTEPSAIVCSGAFALAEAGPDRVVLERREGSIRRGGNVRRVEIDTADDDNAHDDVDLAWGLWVMGAPPDAESDLRMEHAAGLGYLVLDHRDEGIRSLELRRALAHAVDRSRLQSSYTRNVLAATGGMVPPLLQGHTPDIALPHDPELARRLLEESGFTGVVRLGVPDDRVDAAVVLAVGEMLEAIGVAIERVAEDDRPMAWVSGWYPGYPDPEYFLRLLLHSEAKDNFGLFEHAPFDELVERARAETDGRRRLELFHAADRMAVAEQVAAIPLGYFRNVARVKPWVHGWWEYGKSWSSFADLVVDERD
jgi:oligopeptide transport system substrate-binding protein